MSVKLSIESIANGGVIERICAELQKAIDNIVDPGTPAKKSRSVTAKITLKPTEDRDMASVSVEVKSSLAPSKPIDTIVGIGIDSRTGEVIAEELVIGENREQHTLPEVNIFQNGKIAKFTKVASAGE